MSHRSVSCTPLHPVLSSTSIHFAWFRGASCFLCERVTGEYQAGRLLNMGDQAGEAAQDLLLQAALGGNQKKTVKLI